PALIPSLSSPCAVPALAGAARPVPFRVGAAAPVPCSAVGGRSERRFPMYDHDRGAAAPPPSPGAAGSRPGRSRLLLAGLGGALPTALVLAALAGLAWWGHRTGWALPSLAALTGGEVTEKDDWCDEHGVPESACIECNPGLMPRGPDYGWCKDHGVHNCPLEHPEMAQLRKQPQVTAADLERARRALDLMPRPENGSKCKLYTRRLQFGSQESVEKAGIDVKAVDRALLVESVPASGEVTYDQTRVARLSARVPGSVWRAYKGVGDPVKRG